VEDQLAVLIDAEAGGVGRERELGVVVADAGQSGMNGRLLKVGGRLAQP
jgi:hypothetical protein